MGVAYRLDAALGLTLTVFDGKITGEEWRSVARAIFADPGWPPGLLSLTDLRTADASALSDSDRAEVVAINGSHADQLAAIKNAAIGGRNFEAAQRFERESQLSGLRLIVFDDLPNACVWLGLDANTVREMIEQLRPGQLQNPKPIADSDENGAPNTGPSA